ncbi:hypothetical protein Tsubulata_048130 [Turnera subulata]|uniref:VWFA domain-containing protein n=1 Tax=Turnera subulata TaxID=218843 RepID=A0A9Q0FY04_9ROSI|nr:hypothetical protein Tsubulata_048130 [Turnera subulata]
MSVNDALKKAAKVIEDRREKNPISTILILSDGHDNSSHWNSVHLKRSPPPTWKPRSILLDVTLQLGFVPDSAPAELSAVYSASSWPGVFGPGSIRVGELHGKEEREFLVELKTARLYYHPPSNAEEDHLHHHHDNAAENGGSGIHAPMSSCGVKMTMPKKGFDATDLLFHSVV